MSIRNGAEQFWARTDKRDPHECWIWMGEKDGKGYGRFNIANKTERAHRVSWVLTVGPIPPGWCICHECDNRPCVNPAHLFIGTKADNNADMVAKGRRRGPAKLTPEQADTIRSSKEQSILLARRFGVTADIIRRIRRGAIWKSASVRAGRAS